LTATANIINMHAQILVKGSKGSR